MYAYFRQSQNSYPSLSISQRFVDKIGVKVTKIAPHKIQFAHIAFSQSPTSVLCALIPAIFPRNQL